MQRMTSGEPPLFHDLLAEDRLINPLWAKLPPAERVSDRLADLLFGADEILGFLDEERAASLRWIEPEIRRVYDDVDQLMRKITD